MEEQTLYYHITVLIITVLFFPDVYIITGSPYPFFPVYSIFSTFPAGALPFYCHWDYELTKFLLTFYGPCALFGSSFCSSRRSFFCGTRYATPFCYLTFLHPTPYYLPQVG